MMIDSHERCVENVVAVSALVKYSDGYRVSFKIECSVINQCCVWIEHVLYHFKLGKTLNLFHNL